MNVLTPSPFPPPLLPPLSLYSVTPSLLFVLCMQFKIITIIRKEARYRILIQQKQDRLTDPHLHICAIKVQRASKDQSITCTII